MLEYSDLFLLLFVSVTTGIPRGVLRRILRGMLGLSPVEFSFSVIGGLNL